MPDKKLTDNEIVKAFSKCVEFGFSYNSKLLKATLDLINRLQADCENYKQIAEHQQSVTMDRGFEIKRLKEKIESLQAENKNLDREGLLLNKTLEETVSENDRLLQLLQQAQAENEELEKKADFLQATKNLNQAQFNELKIRLELAEAENERLKAEKDTTLKYHPRTNYPYQVITPYGVVFAKCEKDYDDFIQDIAAEAYEECIEKVKKELSFGKYITAEQLDNLLKELVGDSNAK